MKRVLSLVLAVVLVLGMMPAFAASQTNGEKLQAMGIVNGDENGNLNEGQLLKRGEQVKIVLTMMGLEDKAAAYPVAAPFSDMEGHWSAPYVSYAASIGLVNGYPDGTFKPENYVIGQEFDKMMLGVLDYSVAWTEVPAKAQELGIKVDVTDKKNVERGSAFDSMYSALYIVPNGGTETLGVKLGVMEAPAPTYLKVTGIKPLNLIQFEVEFNTAPDAFEAKNLKIVNDSDKSMSLSAKHVDFTKGQTTAVVTLNRAVGQQNELDITVKDVMYNKEKMANYTAQDIVFLDRTLPEVESMSVVGEKTLKVVFSEPMRDGKSDKAELDQNTTLNKNDFEVNDGKLYISTVKLQKNNTEALIELYSELKAGDIKLAVKAGSEDFAGFSVTPETQTLTVVVDTTAPTVVGYEKASATSVTLIWSEDIVVKSNSTNDFYHTNSNNTVKSVPTVDGNKMTLDFSDNNLPNGTAYVYVLKDAVQDLWSNKNVQQMETVNVEVDNTAPTVNSIETKAEDKIVVTFSEKVEATSATDKDNYKLLDKEGKEVTSPFRNISVGTGDKADEVTITFKTAQSGDMALEVKDVKDLSDNVMTAQTVPFNVTDTTAPDPTKFEATLYNQGAENQYVIINFGEEMMTSGDFSITDATKYKFQGTTGSTNLESKNSFYELNDMIDEVNATLEVVENGSAVKIAVDAKTSDGGFTFDLGANKVVIGRVADKAGNYMTEYSISREMKNGNSEELVIEKRVATKDGDNFVVSITMQDELVNVDAEDFLLTNSKDLANEFGAQKEPASKFGKAKYEISSREVSLNSDKKTVIAFTLTNSDKGLNKDMTTGTDIFVGVRDDAKSKNQYDQIVKNTTDVKVDQHTEDKMKPEVKKTDKKYEVEYTVVTTHNGVAVNNVTPQYIGDVSVVVTFTENVKDASFTQNAFSVNIGGKDYTFEIIEAAQNGSDNNTVVLTKSFTADDKVLLEDAPDMAVQIGTTDGGTVYDLEQNALEPVNIGEVQRNAASLVAK